MKKVRITYIQDGIEKKVGKYRFNHLKKGNVYYRGSLGRALGELDLTILKDIDSICIENMRFTTPTKFSCIKKSTKIVFKDCEFATSLVELYDGFYQLVRPKFTSPRTKIIVDAKEFEMNLLRDSKPNLDANIDASNIVITNSKGDDNYNLFGKNISLVNGTLPSQTRIKSTQLYLNGLSGDTRTVYTDAKSLIVENSQLNIEKLDCIYQQLGFINSKIRIGKHSKINGTRVQERMPEIEITSDNIKKLTAESNLLRVLKEVRLQATKAQEQQTNETVKPYETEIIKEKDAMEDQYRSNMQRLDNKLEAIKTETSYQIGKMKVKELLPVKKS